jgi:hypothetical protein
MMNRLTSILLMFVALNFSGCKTYQPIQFQPGQLTQQLKVGEKVTLETNDGKIHKIIVSKIENDSIVGDGETIKAGDVVVAERAELNVKDTVATASFIAYSILAIYVLFFVGFPG